MNIKNKKVIKLGTFSMLGRGRLTIFFLLGLIFILREGEQGAELLEKLGLIVRKLKLYCRGKLAFVYRAFMVIITHIMWLMMPLL